MVGGTDSPPRMLSLSVGARVSRVSVLVPAKTSQNVIFMVLMRENSEGPRHEAGINPHILSRYDDWLSVPPTQLAPQFPPNIFTTNYIVIPKTRT